MDNQQERLIWLSGFIDGEGHLGATTREHTVKQGEWHKAYKQITPRICLTNTSDIALERVTQIADNFGLAYYIGWKAPGKCKRTRWQWQMEISGVKRVKRFLEAIMPYLVVKKPQAEALYAYCASRLERVVGNDTRNAMLTEEDLKITETIKSLNQNPQRTYAELPFTKFVNPNKRKKICAGLT